jgi:GntR family transcriptional repressor for pyruvate dehydrogenase complex
MATEKSGPLVEQITGKLIDYIINNNLKAGEKLPNEFALTQLLGVGRSTVREAVKTLVSRNVLKVKQGAGTFVAAKQLGMSADPLGFTFVKDKKKLATDLLTMRIIIEPNIAAMAAVNADAEDIEQIEGLCREVEGLIFSSADHTEKDIAFHTKVAHSSKNLVAPHLLPIIESSIALFTDLTNNAIDHQTTDTHRALVTAIKNRDAVAASDAVYLHLIYNRNKLREIFGELTEKEE